MGCHQSKTMEISVLLGRLLLDNQRVKLNLFTSWGIHSWCRTIKWCLIFLQWVRVRYHFKASGSKRRSLVHLTGFKLCLGGHLWVKFSFLGIQPWQQWLWAGHEQVTWTNAWGKATKTGEEEKVLNHRQQTHWLLGLKPVYYNHKCAFFCSLNSTQINVEIISQTSGSCLSLIILCLFHFHYFLHKQ